MRPRTAHESGEPRSAISILLRDRQIAYLDVMSALAWLRHRKPVSRADFVEGLVEYMSRDPTDFSQFASTGQMVAYLVERFRKNPSRLRNPLLRLDAIFASSSEE